jgi:hypothetical protein
MRSMIFAILALVCLTIPADACHGGGSGRQQRGRLLFRGRQRNAQTAYVQEAGYTTVRTSSWVSGPVTSCPTAAVPTPVQTAPAPVRVTPVLP